MANEDVFVEAIWSSPQTTAFFLERCEIYLQVRNKSNRPVQIEKVECRFLCEADVEPFVPDVTPFLTLDSGHLSPPIRVVFNADLALKAGTNRYHVVIHYCSDNAKTLEYDQLKYLIFKPVEGGRQFFISHKDPEDTAIARQLRDFLGKVGFVGYISEEDRRPGVGLWEEKIPNAIALSIGLIILWTTNAARDPESIYREIDLAKSNGKRLIMALEEGVAIPPPDIFPRDIEYFRFESPLSSPQLKTLACSIEDTHRRGGYSDLKRTAPGTGL